MTSLLEFANMEILLPHSMCTGSHDQQQQGEFYGDEQVYTDRRMLNKYYINNCKIVKASNGGDNFVGHQQIEIWPISCCHDMCQFSIFCKTFIKQDCQSIVDSNAYTFLQLFVIK